MQTGRQRERLHPKRSTWHLRPAANFLPRPRSSAGAPRIITLPKILRGARGAAPLARVATRASAAQTLGRGARPALLCEHSGNRTGPQAPVRAIWTGMRSANAPPPWPGRYDTEPPGLTMISRQIARPRPAPPPPDPEPIAEAQKFLEDHRLPDAQHARHRQPDQGRPPSVGCRPPGVRFPQIHCAGTAQTMPVRDRAFRSISTP